ncbi:hypothetical protein T06_1012 [Trichinella sp. T6]|nr:hypothetical protein T06_1012 [Trichinella sp. T6]
MLIEKVFQMSFVQHFAVGAVENDESLSKGDLSLSWPLIFSRLSVTSQFCVPIYADGFLLLIIEKLFIHFVQMPPVVIRKLSTINHCKEIYETVQR